MNKYMKPVPEKYQRQARLRRLAQQRRLPLGLTEEEYTAAVAQVEKDYKSWKTV